jgi:hypothetical protein
MLARSAKTSAKSAKMPKRGYPYYQIALALLASI